MTTAFAKIWEAPMMRLLGLAAIVACCGLATAGCSIDVGARRSSEMVVRGPVFAAYEAAKEPVTLSDVRVVKAEDALYLSDRAKAEISRAPRPVLLAEGGLSTFLAAAMPLTSVTFSDGTIANLDVGAPWWSWFWLGLIYQPARGTVTVFKNVQEQVHPWWCLWLCTETETVQQPANATIRVDAMGYTSNSSGEQTTDQGEDSCESCSSVTHYVHNFGFPLPPWAGGGGFQGIGFRGAVGHGTTLFLHNHWGTDKTKLGAPAFPADFD